MSIPVNGYQASEVKYTILTGGNYVVEFTTPLVYGADNEEIAQLLEDATTDMVAAIETAHPGWTVTVERTYRGLIQDNP